MRNIVFTPNALAEYSEWATNDKKVFQKLVSLVQEISRSPFEGTGKPEPLKFDLKGHWSRRITQEHRLVYKIEGNIIIISSCKYHY